MKHSPERLESMILGCMVGDPELIDLHPLQPDDFAVGKHQRIYAALRQMRNDGDAIDMVTLPERIARTEQPGMFGGVGYVMQLTDDVPSPHALRAYLETFQADAMRRKARQAIGRRLEVIDHEDPAGVLTQLVGDLEALMGNGTQQRWMTLADATEIAVERMAADATDEGAALRTGWESFDAMVKIKPGKMIVIGARPGMGKSTLVQEIATNIAGMTPDKSIGLFLLEMDGGEMAHRMLLSCAEAPESCSGMARDSKRLNERFRGARDRNSALPIYFADHPAMTIEDLIAAAKALKSRCDREGPPLGMLAVDYLQLMDVRTAKGATRAEAIGHVSRKLKMLARSLDVPVFVLCQLNRKVEQRPDKVPLLSDLRESGAIEQDADAVVLMVRPWVYDKAQRPEEMKVIVAKNRAGPTGEIDMFFRGAWFQIREHQWGADEPEYPSEALEPRGDHWGMR